MATSVVGTVGSKLGASVHTRNGSCLLMNRGWKCKTRLLTQVTAVQAQHTPLDPYAPRWISTSTCHSSVYPPTYIKPIYREEQLKELEETGEKVKLAFTPIYPAHGDENASVFHDPLVNKFINHIMEQGKKELARSIVEQAFATIKRTQLTKYYKTTDPKERESIELNPWKIFHAAIHNAGPVLETMSIKRGGGTYQVPVPVKDNRRTFLAMKWIIEASLDKDPELRMYKKLAWELLDAANDQGRVIKRKQDLHKVCEANRAYAHYRWG